MRIFLSFIITFLLFNCTIEKQPIRFGEDNCAYCKMIISDQRYGAELLTTKGKDYKFDSIECMAAYVLMDQTGTEDLHSIWVIDFNSPEKFIDAQKTHYLHSSQLKSPMSLNFSAFENLENAKAVQNVYPGEIIAWNDVKSIVNKKWLQK